MKISKLTTMLLFVCFSFIGNKVFAQAATTTPPPANANGLNTYVIERDIPGAGKLTTDELKGISQKSCATLKELGAGIVWLQSYVTADKIFCIYQAKDEKIIREHAAKGGFPVTKITQVSNVISPETAK